MSNLTLAATARPAAQVLFRELNGEGILLSLETGKYFGLNEVGTRIWQLLPEQASLQRLCDVLATEFDADAPTIEAEVVRLVDDLRVHGLVALTDTPSQT